MRRRLDCVRQVRCTHDTGPFQVSAHVRRRLEKLRHLASVRLTCMLFLFNCSDIILFLLMNELMCAFLVSLVASFRLSDM